MIIPQYIPDVMASIVEAVSVKNVAAGRESVKFDFGHYAEVTKNLTLKGEAVNDATRDKYPLVWLVMDFDELMNPFPNKYAQTSLHLIIATSTTAQYDMKDRRDISFLPVLYPIFALLIEEIAKDKRLGNVGLSRLKYRKTDRPYWGGSDKMGNSDANFWNDWIDAIQIRDLNIQLNNIC